MVKHFSACIGGSHVLNRALPEVIKFLEEEQKKFQEKWAISDPLTLSIKTGYYYADVYFEGKREYTPAEMEALLAKEKENLLRQKEQLQAQLKAVEDKLK